MPINKDFIIEKRNILNEIRSNSMTLQELRFFSIYLAKINARDASTRLVRFSLLDFQKIMGFGKLNLAQLNDTVNRLLCKIVSIPLESGGYEQFQLFKKCRTDKDEDDEWYIEIDAHDDALPLMFEFKERYFTYELWNALRLKSSNQLRMYEILKQYEGVGERIISVGELRSLLGIDESEYPRFNSFRERVIDVCREALAENTDIKFDYKPAKRGARGKIKSLKFTIVKNINYKDQLSLDSFINLQKVPDAPASIEIAADIDGDGYVDSCNYFDHHIYPVLSSACGDEFNTEEMAILYDLTVKNNPPQAGTRPEDYFLYEAFPYIKRKHNELKRRVKREDLDPIKSRFGYLKKIMEAELASD